MPFVFRMEGQVPYCPKCGNGLEAIVSQVVQGRELTEAGETAQPDLQKMVHSCPYCHVFLAMTDY